MPRENVEWLRQDLELEYKRGLQRAGRRTRLGFDVDPWRVRQLCRIRHELAMLQLIEREADRQDAEDEPW